MSCEQLLFEIENRGERIPSGSKDASILAACAVALVDGCPSNRSQLTHTSRMLSAERNAEVDRIWQDAKKKAETLLSEL